MVPVGEKALQVGTDGGGEWTGVQDFRCMVTESRGRLWYSLDLDQLRPSILNDLCFQNLLLLFFGYLSEYDLNMMFRY